MNPICTCTNTAHQCPSSANLVSASSMIPTRTRTPSPTSQLSESPTEHGLPQRCLNRMASPTLSLSKLRRGCSVLVWTHTWSGIIEGRSHEFSISGESVSSVSGRTNIITGCLSTLTVFQLHEFGAMILDELEQSAVLGSEQVPFDEWKWVWEWAQ